MTTVTMTIATLIPMVLAFGLTGFAALMSNR